MTYLDIIREIMNYSVFVLIIIASLYSIFIYLFHKHSYWFWQSLALTSIAFASVGSFFIPLGIGNAPFLLNVTLPALLGGTFFYIATKKILGSVKKIDETSRLGEDVPDLSLLSDDAVIIHIYNVLLQNFILETGETIGIENQKKILDKHFEYNPIIFHNCEINASGNIDLQPMIQNLKKINKDIKRDLIHRTFNELIEDLVENHSKVTSPEHSRKILGGIYLKIQDRYKGKSVVFDILRSIPEDVLAEERLGLLSRDELKTKVEERTSELENLMNTMVDILIELNPDGEIEMVNNTFMDVLNYKKEEVLGISIDKIICPFDDENSLDDFSPHIDFVEWVENEEVINDYEINYMTKCGNKIPMSVSASVTRDENDSLKNIVCVAKDIRERKDAEERAEFLHSLLRHDLGNKLQVIYGYLELIDKQELSEEYKGFIENSMKGLDNSFELIKNIRLLNKIDERSDIQKVDLYLNIQDSIDRHLDKIKEKNFEIENNVDKSRKVKAGLLLNELFSNLIENSLKHSEGNIIRFTLEEEEDYYLVRYEDDGKGIPDNIKKSVTEKGFKSEYSSGSGLGMFLVKNIINIYDGELIVRDSDLGGVRFDVFLRKA